MAKDTASVPQEKASIIAAVKTPLGFFALAVLIGETGLLAFAKEAEGAGRTIGIVGMIALLLASCAAVYFLAFRGKTELTRFSRRIEGLWWERINYPEGSAVGFFRIIGDPLNANVMLQGTSYSKDGETRATWHSEMARLYPAERRIGYVWRGRHTLAPIANQDFHGYATMEFQATEDESAALTQGRGDFWDVDQTHPQNTVFKPSELHRVTDENDKRIMLSGSKAQKKEVVVRVIDTW